MQETPILSGSGARRGKRSNVYDIPEDGSPVRQFSAVPEESFLQEDIARNEDLAMDSDQEEESFVAQIGDETTNAEVEDLIDLEESEVAPEPVKVPAKRGRKRKSDVIEPAPEDDVVAAKSRKRGPGATKVSETQAKGKKSDSAANGHPRRSQRVSDIHEMESSQVDALIDASVNATEQEVSVAPKRRGRPPRAQVEAGKENGVTKPAKDAPLKEKTNAVFKKPPKPVAKTKAVVAPKSKPEAKKKEKKSQTESEDAGKLVDVHGNPLSKSDIERMSTTSATSRYGRGRHLSVFRELDPDAVAPTTRTGRHRVAPIDFWKNDRIAYDTDGSMTSIVKNQSPEPERKTHKSTSIKGRKKTQPLNDEDDVELDPWEEDEGVLIGNYRDFDPITDVTSNAIIEDSMLFCLLPLPFHLLTLSPSNRLGRKRHSTHRRPRRLFPIHQALVRRLLFQLGAH